MKAEIEGEIQTAVKLTVKGKLNKVKGKTFRLISEIIMMYNSLNKQSNPLNTNTTGASILIIDDNFAIREVLTDILSVTAVVYTAANGQEGLKILQHQRQSISLVLLDMNMPVMNGEQTYEKLQEIAPDIKVVISSSLSQAEAKLRFKQRELPTYLQKPYDVSTLLHIVQTELAVA